MDKMRSFGHLRTVNEEALTVDAVISTGDVARDDAIIDPSGWNFDNYRRNPVVLWSHDDLRGMPVARTIQGPTAGANELIATAEFDREDPEAQRLFSKIKRGFINATSVRWLPVRWEFVDTEEAGQRKRVLVFREQELLEWSFVAIPTDPGAVVLRADGSPLPREVFEPQEGTEEEQEKEGVRLNAVLGPALGRLEAIVERRLTTPNIDTLVVRSLAKATGKTEERVRQDLAAGGYTSA